MDKAGVFDSDIVLKLRQPSIQEAAQFREESTLYSFLYPAQNKDLIDALAARKLTAFGKSHIFYYLIHSVVSRVPFRTIKTATKKPVYSRLFFCPLFCRPVKAGGLWYIEF